MIQDRDHFEAYYANKLWNLLPAVYRSLDTNQVTSFGPLREMVNRIGKQAAILRRSIDRMWQDQSIETCDDWVIPYIADLLATNLVANLNAAEQRLDVANTIYYRRRKGTVAVLEEIAADITGWDAKVVEFFRRMARTRHGLDPAIGFSLQSGDAIEKLQLAEGLVGPITGTPIGGTARLTNIYGATRVGSAFDEFFHTADLRYGQGRTGWYNIPRLGVFLWRLKSFFTGPVTPVQVNGCDGWFTFDPTGRDIPLFARGGRTSDYYATQWVSPVESQLATPISQELFDADGFSAPASPPIASPPMMCQGTTSAVLPLYPNSLAVYPTPAHFSTQDALDPCLIVVRPEHGRVHVLASPSEPVWLQYCYGFPDTTGAGPYSRRLVRPDPSQPGTPTKLCGGGTFAASTGTYTINDSLTYDTPGDVTMIDDLTIMAADQKRPLLRFLPSPPGWTEWTITGSGGNLVLDGLFVSGADIVLAGTFKSVKINCCTLDPGSAVGAAANAWIYGSPPSPPGSSVFAISADGRDLVPCRLWIEATIGTLTIARCVMGPVRTRALGEVDTVSISDSTVQAIPRGDLADVNTSPPDRADSALEINDGDVTLLRCTILGRAYVHRLQASDSILNDVTIVDDAQNGCVRFSCWATGSVLPRQYESVQTGAAAPLFTSTDFGQPGYCQLSQSADSQIIPPAETGTPAAPPTILAGSEKGSEMGAFCLAQNSIKEEALLIKYREYMPAQLTPVVIYAT
jgi:hypothetical protein